MTHASKDVQADTADTPWSVWPTVPWPGFPVPAEEGDAETEPLQPTDDSTAACLGQFRRELLAEGFDPIEVASLVKMAAQEILTNTGLRVRG